jgi:hypothetical protein
LIRSTKLSILSGAIHGSYTETFDSIGMDAMQSCRWFREKQGVMITMKFVYAFPFSNY